MSFIKEIIERQNLRQLTLTSISIHFPRDMIYINQAQLGLSKSFIRFISSLIGLTKRLSSYYKKFCGTRNGQN